jgi:hypothetical protein
VPSSNHVWIRVREVSLGWPFFIQEILPILSKDFCEKASFVIKFLYGFDSYSFEHIFHFTVLCIFSFLE